MSENERLYNEALKLLNNCDGLYVRRNCVACGLLAKNGKIYTGVNIYTWDSTCAEAVALGSALKEKQMQIKKCIALKFDDDGKVIIVSPCGRCREMFNILEIGVKFIIGRKDGKFIVKTIKSMLPNRYLK